jgi:site-specific recombinase XerD
MSNKNNLAKYMNSFFNDYLSIQRGLSGNTILAYRDSLKLLFCFIADQSKKSVEDLLIEDLDQKAILDFLDHIETTKACSIKTRNARLSAIRTFFKFIAREEPVLLHQAQTVRSITKKREPHKAMDYLNNSEMSSILSSIDLRSKTGARDKALLLLMFNTGARVQEVVDLKLADLRLDSCEQVKLLGKGRKQRACPLWKDTVKALKLYLKTRSDRHKTQNSLFLNANGDELTRFGIRYIIKKFVSIAAKKCFSITNKNIGPHTLRHSTAMHLIQSGNDINMVSIWLGHADINTTHCYIELDLEMKKNMLANASPPEAGSIENPEWKKDAVLSWLEALSSSNKLCGVINAHFLT